MPISPYCFNQGTTKPCRIEPGGITSSEVVEQVWADLCRFCTPPAGIVPPAVVSWYEQTCGRAAQVACNSNHRLFFGDLCTAASPATSDFLKQCSDHQCKHPDAVQCIRNFKGTFQPGCTFEDAIPAKCQPYKFCLLRACDRSPSGMPSKYAATSNIPGPLQHYDRCTSDADCAQMGSSIQDFTCSVDDPIYSTRCHCQPKYINWGFFKELRGTGQPCMKDASYGASAPPADVCPSDFSLQRSPNSVHGDVCVSMGEAWGFVCPDGCNSQFSEG